TLFASGEATTTTPGASGYGVFAFNPKNGAYLWQGPVAPDEAAQAVPLVSQNRVYVGGQAPTGSPGHLYAFLVSGCGESICAPNWVFATGQSRVGGLAAAKTTVYVNASSLGTLAGDLYAINATTGSQVWHDSTTDAYTSPIVANGVLYQFE